MTPLEAADACNRYRVEGLLGTGGRGAVYRAYDTFLQRPVALKRVGAATGDHDGAWREGINLAAVTHPNVVTVYDCGIDEAGPFLVIELVAGETLEQVVRRGAFPYRDFCLLARQSLAGLAAAHEAGLLHRDLKPGNLMLERDLTGDLIVKLTDFDIAGFTASVFGDVLPSASDLPGTILGTVEFMSPEQFERGPVSARSELYSMGCIFYYALTASDPFVGDDVESIAAGHLSGRVIPLGERRADLPAAVCDWVMRLFSRRAEDRPATVMDALLEFRALAGDSAW